MSDLTRRAASGNCIVSWAPVRTPVGTPSRRGSDRLEQRRCSPIPGDGRESSGNSRIQCCRTLASTGGPKLKPNIVRLGHPALRSHAEPVDVEELARGDLGDLVAALSATLDATGARCIAAPQIGAGVQMLLFRSAAPESGSGTTKQQVVANPMVEAEHGDLVYDWEDCLSIPQILGLVPRHPQVRIRGVDANGQPVDFVAEGNDARVIQHAHDHLSGVMFLDRMRDLRSLTFADEWRRFIVDGKPGPESTEA